MTYRISLLTLAPKIKTDMNTPNVISEKELTHGESHTLSDAEYNIQCAHNNLIATANILYKRGYFKLAKTLYGESEKIQTSQQWLKDEISDLNGRLLNNVSS